MKIVPICKYGHGDLVEILPQPPDKSITGDGFMLNAYELNDVGQASLAPYCEGLSLFSCQTCGYSEIFNKDFNEQSNQFFQPKSRQSATNPS